jgi:hypothetical protein
MSLDARSRYFQYSFQRQSDFYLHLARNSDLETLVLPSFLCQESLESLQSILTLRFYQIETNFLPSTQSLLEVAQHQSPSSSLIVLVNFFGLFSPKELISLVDPGLTSPIVVDCAHCYNIYSARDLRFFHGFLHVSLVFSTRKLHGFNYGCIVYTPYQLPGLPIPSGVAPFIADILRTRLLVRYFLASSHFKASSRPNANLSTSISLSLSWAHRLYFLFIAPPLESFLLTPFFRLYIQLFSRYLHPFHYSKSTLDCQSPSWLIPLYSSDELIRFINSLPQFLSHCFLSWPGTSTSGTGKDSLISSQYIFFRIDLFSCSPIVYGLFVIFMQRR